MRKGKGNGEKSKFRRSREWREFSRLMREGSGGICQCCGTKSRTLQVHHMDPANYDDLSDKDKFAVVCRSCHSEISRLERIKKENWIKYDPVWVACFSRFLL